MTMGTEHLTIGPDQALAAGVHSTHTDGLQVLHLSIGPLQLEVTDTATISQLAAVVDVAMDLARRTWLRCQGCRHTDAVVDVDGWHPTCRLARSAAPVGASV